MSYDKILAMLNTATGIGAFALIALLLWRQRNIILDASVLLMLVVLTGHGSAHTINFAGYPVLGGSIYFPTFCVIYAGVARKYSTEQVRRLTFAICLALSILLIGNARWIIFELIDQDGATFLLKNRITEMSADIRTIIACYFAGIVIAFGQFWMNNSLWRCLIRVGLIMLVITAMQVSAFKGTLAIPYYELFATTFALRMAVATLMFFIVWMYYWKVYYKDEQR